MIKVGRVAQNLLPSLPYLQPETLTTGLCCKSTTNLRQIEEVSDSAMWVPIHLFRDSAMLSARCWGLKSPQSHCHVVVLGRNDSE